MEVLESGKGELFLSPRMNEDRQWMREKKSWALEPKTMSEHEAVKKFIHEGDYIGTELYGFVRCPMSIAREIVRQRIGHLQVAGQGIMEVDILIAAGLVDKIDLTYLGYEVYGLSSVLRRAAQSGKLKVNEWSNAALAWRLKAAALGVPFLPVRVMLGTDTFKYSAAKVAKCPFTGEKVLLLPATMLDVGIIHVHRADQYGNCQIDGISGFAFELARASRRLIISAEEIISTEEIRMYPERTIIPWYLVDAVVEAPFGSHPGEMPYYYWRDEEHLSWYVAASKEETTTEEYLQKWIWDVPSHEDYLERVGKETLDMMKAKAKGR
ncbi:MAG: CoA transferase subunit A [Theionarchaea archaeon]|nr:CoA transferase subunit A [Theionarchaea archaeon]MBU6999502.1 CoA transferase subunit A [Theionarchaea archaeon]MBU7021086.1 CoA transferase subunit A [Theionarchaea archaeon]MBU7035616.1 CoA transferase subunit A [Theionarchaea archaeon]MBU7040522.1 CoA transferase subunit A [Theionarchaea archaeon]